MTHLIVLLALMQTPRDAQIERAQEIRHTEAYQRRLERQARIRARVYRYPDMNTLWNQIPHPTIFYVPMYSYPYYRDPYYQDPYPYGRY